MVLLAIVMLGMTLTLVTIATAAEQHLSTATVYLLCARTVKGISF